jgi:hypothetical protein
LGNTLRRGLALDRIHLPGGITVWGLAGSFLIPGLGVYLRGPRIYGKAAFAGWVILFLFFIVWLGYPFGNGAFGLMLALHAIGFVYYCRPHFANQTSLHRPLFTLAALMGIGLSLYLPIRHMIQNHWLIPLRNGGQVIIVLVQRPGPLRRGDWAAFKRNDGVLFGQIAGLGGDQIDSLTVPENHWLMRAKFVRQYYHEGFFFPTYSGRMDFVEQSIIVSPEEFIGKPFKRWFWRKQILQ